MKMSSKYSPCSLSCLTTISLFVFHFLLHCQVDCLIINSLLFVSWHFSFCHPHHSQRSQQKLYIFDPEMVNKSFVTQLRKKVEAIEYRIINMHLFIFNGMEKACHSHALYFHNKILKSKKKHIDKRAPSISIFSLFLCEIIRVVRDGGIRIRFRFIKNLAEGKWYVERERERVNFAIYIFEQCANWFCLLCVSNSFFNAMLARGLVTLI